MSVVGSDPLPDKVRSYLRKSRYLFVVGQEIVAHVYDC